MQKIRLAIIGAGRVTTDKGRHIDSIWETKDTDISLVALADVIPGFARSVADRFDVPLAFDDYRELLRRDDIDAVTINTPNNTHKDIAIDCLRAGKHVYLEKPITETTAELEEIIGVAKESGKIFLAGSNGLLQKQMATFRGMIDRGSLGEVYMVSIERASSMASDYGKETGPKSSDGVSIHSGSHNVEWALYFLGDPKPVSVVAKGYFKANNISIPWEDHNEDDDICHATVLFDNGSSFMYKASRYAPVKDVYEMKVYGDKMCIEYDVYKCYKQKLDDCIAFYHHDELAGMQVTRPMYRCDRSHAAMYRYFFKSIRENDLKVSACERGLVTMQILDAMRQSIELGGKQVML